LFLAIPTQNSYREDGLLPLNSSSTSKYATRNVKELQKNGTHELLIFVDGVNLPGGKCITRKIKIQNFYEMVFSSDRWKSH
jgi:hypothetical protein